jgi:cell division FtsZ-interacting protein ZapD
MKHNTEKTTELITQAIRLCNDFALSNAKSYLYAALNEIVKVNKKREIREKLQKQLDRQMQDKKLKEEQKRKKFLQDLENPQLDVNIENGQQEI